MRFLWVFPSCCHYWYISPLCSKFLDHIMIVVILCVTQVAKWVGDTFNEGLYDHHIELKSTPFLGWESPDRMDRLIAADVMNSENLCYVYPITRVRSVENLLRTTAHSAFLVVTPVSTKDMPTRKTNISESHVPALYTRPSRVELYNS